MDEFQFNEITIKEQGCFYFGIIQSTTLRNPL